MTDENGEEIIKCERRYNNFFLFNLKLRRRYPYCLIPKLTEKHPISEIIYPNEDFYLNREIQLRFYLSYINKHDLLGKSKEFYKFLNDAEFDESYFSQEDLPYSFTSSVKLTESVKNKVYGFISGMFGKKDELRLPTEEEMMILKMEAHFKSFLKNYLAVKQSICAYLKEIKASGDNYKTLAHTSSYLKDNFNENVIEAKEQFRYFSLLSQSLAVLNKEYHNSQANIIENRLEVK
jgi:hypothetical protein